MDYTEEQEAVDEMFTTHAIVFFRSLIRHRQYEGKDTRPVNFAGNIGRHMDKRLSRWFTKRYPNNTDYVKFFIQNDSIFTYDGLTGNVDINTAEHNGQPVADLKHLKDLAVSAANQGLALSGVSDIAFEVELFLLLIRLSTDEYNRVHQCNESKESNKTREDLKTSRVAEELKTGDGLRIRSKDAVKWALRSVVRDPRVNQMYFEIDLMDYVSHRYSAVFRVDRWSHILKLDVNVIQRMKQFDNDVDDCVYEVLRHLIAKFIEERGKPFKGQFFDIDRPSVAIEDLEKALNYRHPILMHRVFRTRKTADDYTLLTFCESFGDSFVIGTDEQNRRYVLFKSAVGEESDESDNEQLMDRVGQFLNRIGQNNSANEQKIVADKPNDSDDEVYCSEDEEVYDSSLDEKSEDERCHSTCCRPPVQRQAPKVGQRLAVDNDAINAAFKRLLVDSDGESSADDEVYISE